MCGSFAKLQVAAASGSRSRTAESTTGRTGLRSWQAYCPPGQAGPRHSAKLNNNNRKEGTRSPGDGQQAI